MPLFLLIGVQVIHLLYHQITTLFDLFPFNGARHYSLKEKLIEAGVNLVLMGLPPLGFYLQNAALMNFGVVYYFSNRSGADCTGVLIIDNSSATHLFLKPLTDFDTGAWHFVLNLDHPLNAYLFYSAGDRNRNLVDSLFL